MKTLNNKRLASMNGLNPYNENSNTKEDKQILHKKRRYCGCGNKNMYYKEEDVKSSLSNLKKRLKEELKPQFEKDDPYVDLLFKKFAGDKLI